MEALSAVILVSAYHPPTKEEATFYVLATTLMLLIPHNHGSDCLCVGKKSGFKNGLVIKLKTLKKLVIYL